MARYREQDVVRTIGVRPIDNGEFEGNDQRLKATFDLQDTVIYIGYAPKGTATSAASWTIRKVELDGDGLPTSATWTAERVAVWDNRASEAYT